MTQRSDLMRCLWLAAKAAGGMLRIGSSIAQDYPGDREAFVTISIDPTFGDLVISAQVRGEEAKR